MTERNPPSSAAFAAGDLLDFNVGLALAIEEHPHHAAAASYWSRQRHAVRFFCTDAYFAALARRGRVRLVTFDKDFERFDHLALLRLSTGPH